MVMTLIWLSLMRVIWGRWRGSLLILKKRNLMTTITARIAIRTTSMTMVMITTIRDMNIRDMTIRDMIIRDMAIMDMTIMDMIMATTMRV